MLCHLGFLREATSHTALFHHGTGQWLSTVINMAESACPVANMILILERTSSAKLRGKNIGVLGSGLVYTSDLCKIWHVATDDMIILKFVLHC